MNGIQNQPTVSEAATALILGASGTLGTALVSAFQEKSWRVLGTGFQRPPEVRPALQFDVTQAAGVASFEAWSREHAPRLDAVVHCIGVAHDSLVTAMTDDQWRAALNVNLKSAYRIAGILLPRLAKQRTGHFIFVSSWAGRTGRAGQSNYAAAKAGLIGLTQSIAREYASRGVLANCIVPGVFRSPMTEKLSPEALERLWNGAALRQFADLGEMARFIEHLAGMRGVTGQVFQLDGRIASAIG